MPFRTFGEAAAFEVKLHVICRCGRRVVIDGTSDFFRDRPFTGNRFRCTTILSHGEPCHGHPSITIYRCGRECWSMEEHSRALRERHAGEPLPEVPYRVPRPGTAIGLAQLFYPEDPDVAGRAAEFVAGTGAIHPAFLPA